MDEHRETRKHLAPWMIAGLGFLLTGVAAFWHLGVETQQLGEFRGPLIAFLLDGLLPLTLVYGSYRLVRASVSREQIWTVTLWSFAGALTFGSVIGLSFLIQRVESRPLVEPVFVLLLALETGAVAGFVAGYYATKARRDADRATRTTHTLSFVNDLLRHDVKNGLVVIDGRVANLERNADSEETLASSRAVREQVRELGRLIDNAGAVAETLSADPDFEAIDVVPIVEAVVDQIGTTHEVRIAVDTPESAVVRANDAVRSIFRNLVENAVEHGDQAVEVTDRRAASDPPAMARCESAPTPTQRSETSCDPQADDDRPAILVRVTVTDDTVEIHVVDDGPGIPDAQREHIFDPRAGETHGGGLHLVETLVTAFDGRIWVTDSPMTVEEPTRATGTSRFGGAHFVVELPRA